MTEDLRRLSRHEKLTGEPEIPLTVDGVVGFVANYLTTAEGVTMEINDGVLEIGDPERGIYRVSAVGKGGETIPIEWGATVEGDTPGQDFIEAHLVVAHGDEFVIRVAQKTEADDLSVRAVYEEAGGKKKAVVEKRNPNQVGGIAGEEKGQVTIYRIDTSGGVSTFKATLATQEVDGRTRVYDPKALEQVIHGGIYVWVVPGQIKREPFFPRFKPSMFRKPQPASFGDLLDQYGLGIGQEVSQSFDLEPSDLARWGMRGMEERVPDQSRNSLAADLTAGETVGMSTRVSFEAQPEKAIGFVLRVRIDADQEPPPYTPEWVAWKNREHFPRERYTAIVCGYCGSQVNSSIASMTARQELTVHRNCPHCGGSNFHQVIYSRRAVDRDS